MDYESNPIARNTIEADQSLTTDTVRRFPSEEEAIAEGFLVIRAGMSDLDQKIGDNLTLLQSLADGYDEVAVVGDRFCTVLGKRIEAEPQPKGLLRRLLGRQATRS